MAKVETITVMMNGNETVINKSDYDPSVHDAVEEQEAPEGHFADEEMIELDDSLDTSPDAPEEAGEAAEDDSGGDVGEEAESAPEGPK